MTRRNAVKEGTAEALDAWGAHGAEPPTEETSGSGSAVAQSTKRSVSGPGGKRSAASRRKAPGSSGKRSAASQKAPEKELREKPAGYVERAGDPRRRITAYLTPEMARRLRVYAAGEAVEMSVVIAAALDEYLSA